MIGRIPGMLRYAIGQSVSLPVRAACGVARRVLPDRFRANVEDAFGATHKLFSILVSESFRQPAVVQLNDRRVIVNGKPHVGPLWKVQQRQAMLRGINRERAVFVEGLDRNEIPEINRAAFVTGERSKGFLYGFEDVQISVLDGAVLLLHHTSYDEDVSATQRYIESNVKLRLLSSLIDWSDSTQESLIALLNPERMIEAGNDFSEDFLPALPVIYDLLIQIETNKKGMQYVGDIYDTLLQDNGTWILLASFIAMSLKPYIRSLGLDVGVIERAIDFSDNKTAGESFEIMQLEWRNWIVASYIADVIPELPAGMDIEIITGIAHIPGLVKIFEGKDQDMPLWIREKLEDYIKVDT